MNNITFTKVYFILFLNKIIAILGILLLFPSLSFAADYYVKITALGSGDGTTWETAWNRQQFTHHLYNNSSDGDIYHLAAGTYNPWFNSVGQANVSNTGKRFLIKKNIKIEGGYGANPVSGDLPANDWTKVILSGDFTQSGSTGNATNVVVIADGVTDVKLEFITISGGKGAAQGAGVFVGANAKVNFNYVRITNNRVSSRGGGMYVSPGADVLVGKSLVDNNLSSDRGGGINVYNAKLNITSTPVNSNTASTWGGGMHIENSTCNISDALFNQNTAAHGGAIHNTKATSVSIRESKFTNNIASSHGGAIDNYYGSILTMNIVEFTGNKSTSSWGGAVHNDENSTCSIDNALFDQNTAAHGGAFHNTRSTATISNTDFTKNASSDHGGAIDNYNYSTLTLKKVNIKNNTSGTWGGGMHNDVHSTVVMENSIVYGNKAKDGGGFHNTSSNAYIYSTIFEINEGEEGGAITNYNKYLLLQDCDIRDNVATIEGGGGIHNEAGNIDIRSCLIRDNRTEGSVGRGGGIYSQAGNTLITNTTISGNRSDLYHGGGLYIAANATIISSTITNNKLWNATRNGAGIARYAGTLVLRNTIVSGNDRNGTIDDVYGTVSANSKYNIAGTAFYQTGLSAGNSAVPFNAATHLGTLQNNGGPTLTHALTGNYANNKAMDGGDPSIIYDASTHLLNDQRGELRTKPVSIGAYEYSDPAAVLKANNDTILSFVNNAVTVNQLGNDVIPVGCGTLNILVTTYTAGATAVLESDNRITYNPKAGFAGRDSILYTLECSSNAGIKSSAKIYINMVPKPDNITDADCVLDVVGAGWNINKSNIKVGAKVLHAYTAPVAGDLDGNKIPDVVALGHVNDINAKNIYIYFDRDRANPKVITTPNVYSRNIGGIAIAKVKIGADTTSLIVIHGTDQYLYAYNANGASNQAPVWKSSSVTGVQYTTIGFADFNNDGIPEVYAGKKIYNAVTGVELLASPGNFGASSTHNLPAVADVYGDAKLEYIAGNHVYEVNIVNKNNNTGGQNKMTLVKKLTGYTDGVTVVADFNRDGKLDVAVRIIANPSRIYIWDVEKEQLIAQGTYPKGVDLNSVPFIGDIDGNGDLEIIVVSANKLNVFDYNGTTTLAARTPITIQDASGCTGITLFDFNQDGTAELVYRDEKNLYIYNVVGSTLVPKETISCGSKTVFEYPIVLDVDADGSAEIVVIGGETGAISGYLHILKSATPGTWGPARHVWNQYAYNVVNVNDDLTIPRYQLNPATFFPGRDGVPGINDIQPFNNFLQQQTTLDKNGVPVFLAPNAQIAPPGPLYNYHAAGDSMVVTLTINNVGDASLQSDVYVTVYKDSVKANTAVKYTYAYKNSIAKGTSANIEFTIHNFKTWLGTSDENTLLYLKINDKGDAEDVQPVCNNSGTTDMRPAAYILFAINDFEKTMSNTDKLMDILANDVTSCIPDDLNLTITQMPTNGTAVIEDNKIKYTPNTDYVGIDSITYSIECEAAVSTAKVSILVVDKPDNISDADCVGMPPQTVWDMEVKIVGPQELLSWNSPVVGDLDGDGIPEILAFHQPSRNNYYSNKIYIFYGTNRENPKIFQMKDKGGALKNIYAHDPGAMAIVKADINNDGNLAPIIIVHHTDGKLRAYNPAKPAGSEFVWESNDIAVPTTAPHCATVGIADFNNDGHPEVYTSNRIFDAATGKLLVKGTGNSGYSTQYGEHSYFTHAGNLLGDERLELAAGNQVYDVKINSRTDPALNTITIISQIPAVIVNGRNYSDGFTLLADINKDGKLDVICRAINSASSGIYLYAWDVEKQEIIGDIEFSDIFGGPYRPQVGIPFIGDIDGDGKLEILTITNNRLHTFVLDEPSKKFVRKWAAYAIDDQSGATGITLFDFNQDGTAELIYRDQSKLQILTATATGLVRRDWFTCISTTIFEYPVVADVDNDGHAEIVVIGAKTGDIYSIGQLHIIKSKTKGAWAPARKVWNQYAYNAVNINEDLTVPKIQLNPATFFPGKDGLLGTADDVQPYNAFLQQQSKLNKFGNPLWLVPNAQTVGQPVFTYDVSKDSLVLTVKIHNAGDAALQNPVKITAYKNNIGNALKYTYAYPNRIIPGETATITFGIEKFKEKWTPFNDIVIQINDNGNGYNDQPVCDSADRKFNTGAVIAADDRVLLFKNSTNNEIMVTLNDIKSCSNPTVTIVTNPQHALSYSVIKDSVILYSPNNNYIGNDTLRYSVLCGADSYEATVYITVIEKPDNISDASCVGNVPTYEWGISAKYISTVRYSAYFAPLIGDVTGDGIPNIIVATEDAVDEVYSKEFHVLRGDDYSIVKKINTELIYVQSLGPAAIGKIENEYLFFAWVKGEQKIKAYNITTNTLKWTSTATIGDVLTSAISVSLADFDNDGKPEIYAGNKIFDASTGILLWSGNGNQGKNDLTDFGRTTNMFISFAADVIGDAKLELVAGCHVYDVVIDRGSPHLNVAPVRSIPAPKVGTWQLTKGDGLTQVADINNDGKLDIVVNLRKDSEDQSAIYVWDPRKEELIASRHLTPTDQAGFMSFPFIGDINGDGRPEIVVVYQKSPSPLIGGKMQAFSYVDGNTTLQPNWSPAYPITEYYARTGMTLFDFDQNKTFEIVYRDAQKLRIIDGSGTYPVDKASFPCHSGTGYEYPVIADIDNDGMAEIITVGGPNNSLDTRMHVFTAPNTTKWAPARAVWNQYTYNAVNVNEDLTIPKVQLNPATVFPGEDGQLGTTDDVRPFNGFLQQTTMLNKNGTPLWLLPNAQIGIPAPIYNYYAAGDSMVISLTIDNIGDASLQKDVYITVYKDVVSAGSVKYTYAYPEAIAKGTSKQVTFSIPNFTTWIKPADNNTKLIVKINDKGEAKDHQPVCETGKTIHTKLYSTLLLANNDHAQTLEGNKITIDVLANDSIPTGCSPLITIVSQPANGTAALNATNDSIVYTPTTDSVGYDTISYQIKCNNETSIANIYIKVYSKPDNIVDPSACNVPMSAIDFKIKEQWGGVDIGWTSGTLVGDLDGDGLPEIIAYSSNHTAVNIYNGQTGAFLDSIKFSGADFSANGHWHPCMTSILVDADRNGMAEIIGVNTATRDIYSYEAKRTGGVFSLTLKWKAARPFENPFATDNLPHLNVADFNGDGVPELLIYNQIYNAATGDYLGQTEAMATAHKGCDPGRLSNWNRASNFQTTADIDGDGYPEIVAGGKVYKVNFNVAKTAVTCSVFKRHAEVPDGFTAVADIDMDGNLDVIVASTSPAGVVRLYVWSPLTTWKTVNVVNVAAAVPSRYPGHSFPFIGDIDGFVNGVTGKKHPEICIVTTREDHNKGGKVTAYKYNPTTKALDEKWKWLNSDKSGSTGITLFDFNNDGINELVYRDQTYLRVMNGVADGVAPVLADPGAIIACASATVFEYPVIADTDGDGSANICLSCSRTDKVDGSPHHLRVYESGSQPWAPTRRVWNQVNYEPLQINEDLTVPKMAIPKNMAFNGKHPYNGALIQVPIVDENFKPVMLAPDPATAGLKLEAINSTTLRFWFDVQNKGSRFTNVNLPITLYHTDTIAANIINTKPIGVSLAPGDTVTLYWDVPSSLAYTKFIVRIQDDGAKYPADGSYLDCDYTNNLDSINVLLAVDDIRNTNKNTSLVIDVLANDIYHASCGAIIPVITEGPANGTATIDGNKIKYIANTRGLDSITYKIECNGETSYAKAYVNVLNTPELILEDPCSNQPRIVLTTVYPGMTYKWEHLANGTWQVMGTDTKLNITEKGLYRITITYEGKESQIEKGVEVTINKKIILPGGVVWYDMSYNAVNIVW